MSALLEGKEFWQESLKWGFGISLVPDPTLSRGLHEVGTRQGWDVNPHPSVPLCKRGLYYPECLHFQYWF